MESAVKRPGALRAKAQAAGTSTAAFAHAHDRGNSRTARQSRLAETFAKFRPHQKTLAGHLSTLRARGAFQKAK